MRLIWIVVLMLAVNIIATEREKDRNARRLIESLPDEIVEYVVENTGCDVESREGRIIFAEYYWTHLWNDGMLRKPTDDTNR